jgi:Domain of unknown function (DUF4178)
MIGYLIVFLFYVFFWLIAGGLILSSIFLLIAYLSKRQEESRQLGKLLPSQRRNLLELQLSNRIEYAQEIWKIVGKITCQQHGLHWIEYRLKHNEEEIWLIARESDRLSVDWIAPITGIEITGSIPKTIAIAGKSFRQTDAGMGRCEAQGDVGDRQSGTVRYGIYTSAGDAVLYVEHWDNEYEFRQGIRLSANAVTVS